MSDERIGAIFAALGDSTRRRVVSSLTERGPLTATELAEIIPVSRQAIAKHLGTLADAGLVAGDREGREMRFRLTPGPMAEAVSWMAATGAEWDERLARLRRHFSR